MKIQSFSPADIKRERKLKYFREQTAVADAVARHNLYRACHEAEMNNPENEEYRWLFKRGLRPIGGGAPQQPTTLAVLQDQVVNTTWTTAQSLISASATPGPANTGPVGPFSVDYFLKEGSCWEQEAMGVISTTVTPTIAFGTYWGVVQGTITTVLGITATITTASGLANIDWYYKVMGRTVAGSGSTSTIICTGYLWGNIEALGATGATEPTQAVKNATPPTAVTSDISSQVFIDLKGTWGTSSASNSITVNYYKLQSVYAG